MTEGSTAARCWPRLAVLLLAALHSAHGWVTVSPQGRVTIKAETQVGHWELAEEVDPRKALYVTGDVNVGRDPANVNIWCARNDSKLRKAS